MAPIFRAVRQHRAVRSYRGRDERAQASGAIGGNIPKFISCLDGKRHGVAHQARRVFMCDSAAMKGLESSLVGRRRCHIRARIEVIQMHRADHAGLLDQIFGRPKRVAQIGAAALKFGGQCAIEDDQGLCRQKIFKRMVH
jgi:hypothetical protein